MHQILSRLSRHAALAALLLIPAGACAPKANTPAPTGGANGGGSSAQGGSAGGGSSANTGGSSGVVGGASGSTGGSSSSSSSQGGANNGGGASTSGGTGGQVAGGGGGGSSAGGSVGGASSSPGGSSGTGNTGGTSAKGGAGGGAAGGNAAGGSAAGGNAAGGSSGGSTVVKSACTAAPAADPTMPGYSAADHTKFAAQAATTVANMSLPEKAQQMRGTDPGAEGNRNWNDIFRQGDNAAKKISGFLFRDGPRGVNLDATIHSTGVLGATSTAFPVAMARGAAWDVDLEFRIGQAMGDEMVAAKQTMLLAPTTNILRHPLWGRAQETYGEDSYLLGRLGSASVAGIQQYVPACAKHYAGNNIENGRATKNASMDEQTLREIYARHFEMMIKDGGVACIMAAYNLINGTNCTQNAHLLNDILRTDFGFNGFVLSDWWAIPGGSAGTPNPATGAAAINAGMDMELPWIWDFATIESGMVPAQVTQAQIDTSVKRILEQKYRFGVDAGTGLKSSASSLTGGGSIANPHIDLALEAAVKSMVLLKNDKNTLPISSSMKNIAVVGAKLSYGATIVNNVVTAPGINNVGDDVNGGTIDFASGVRIGDVGSSRVKMDLSKSFGPAGGLKAVAPAGVTITSGNNASVAASADFVVVVAGLTPYDEGEEYNLSGDRTTFSLDGKLNGGTQNKLITDVIALGKPMVVVLEGGSVIDMPWLASVPAVVMAWYPGMVGGKALGQLLFGQANFSGKLPITWPKALSDLPTFNGGTSTTMDYFLGYRYFDNKSITPLYEFGYGMSYTKFDYSNLVVPCSTVTKTSVINVSVDVTNSGTVAGDEVVLLFVSYPNTTKRRSAKELKGFARVSLPAGAKKTVTIPVRAADLKYYDNTSGWAVESGVVKIMVGSSSLTLPLSDTVTVQ